MELVRIKRKEDIYNYCDAIVALGEFDGLHLAHQVIINETIALAKENNCKSALITFYPHPDYVLNTRENKGYLTNEKQKKEILTSLNIDYLLIIDFSKELSQMSYYDFYESYLSNFKGFVMGYDYHFGNKGLGSTDFFCNLNNKIVKVINKQDYYKEGCFKKISSNDIRHFIDDKKFIEANNLLGRNYYFYGRVIHGDSIGRSLGFPTANLSIDEETYLIPNGVYACICTYNKKKYLAVGNMGNNPTLNYIKNARFEIYIVDFNFDIYDKEIKVEILEYLREEKLFDSKLDLIKQMNLDIKFTKEKYGDLCE